MKIILFKLWSNYTESDQRTIFPHSASLSGQLVMKSMTHTAQRRSYCMYISVSAFVKALERAETGLQW